MAFSFRCLLWHSWDGCICRRCNPEARLTVWGWRNRGHDLDGCFCRRCRQWAHDWDGCVCRRCEEAQDRDHEMRAGQCVKCGAAVVGVQEVACGFCNGSGTVFNQGSPQVGDACPACGGGGRAEERVWSAPVEPCVRPRQRPDTEARLATVRRDSNVVALARGIYESRDWSGFVPLRDALMEAGCTDEEVLNHCCRANHVRECWLLRLLLGMNQTGR